MYRALGQRRRVAQTELALTVLREMRGDTDGSAEAYDDLAHDERLTRLDRARARLWVGTALTKAPRPTADKAVAVLAIATAIAEFEDLEEFEDWFVAHQKLALAHLAQGTINQAHDAMDTAMANRQDRSPLQKVKLETARGHLLLADQGTRRAGIALLEACRADAEARHLTHQVASIDRIYRMQVTN